MKRNILLFGPHIPKSNMKGAYGGGTGGYTRNMSVYLNYFKSDKFEIIPCFHTIRGQLSFDNFAWRFIVDAWNLIAALLKNKVSGVHILAQYRTAIPREFFVCLVSKIFNKPLVYEIKAGAFITWYQSTNKVFKGFVDFIIKNADVVLCEGRPYIEFLKEHYEKPSVYFPNYVPDEEIPNEVPERLGEEVIRMLFVGYCFKDKGIYELIEGCTIAANNGCKISLTIIGHEHADFTSWMETQTNNKNLSIERMGRQSHGKVLESFLKNDVYCYPTKHKGEGHNNTINEAMMNGVVIITTKQGFLDTIITPDLGYSLDELSKTSISQNIQNINTNRSEAKSKAKTCRAYLIEHFTASIAHGKLEKVYEKLFNVDQ